MVAARNLLTKLFKGRPWSPHQKTIYILSYGCLLLFLIYLVIFSQISDEKDATLLLCGDDQGFLLDLQEQAHTHGGGQDQEEQS